MSVRFSERFICNSRIFGTRGEVLWRCFTRFSKAFGNHFFRISGPTWPPKWSQIGSILVLIRSFFFLRIRGIWARSLQNLPKGPNTDLSRHVQTYPDLSRPVRTCPDQSRPGQTHEGEWPRLAFLPGLCAGLTRVQGRHKKGRLLPGPGCWEPASGRFP